MSNTPPLAPDFTLDVPGVFAPSHGSLPTVEITQRVGSGVLGVGGVLDTVRVAECIEFMAALPDACVAAVLTDPPYETTLCAWDVQCDWSKWWQQVSRVCKGSVVMTAIQPFTTDLICSNRKEFRYTMVWDKKSAANFAHVSRMPLKTHEDLVVFRQGVFNPQKRRGPKNHSRKVLEWDASPTTGVRPVTPSDESGDKYPNTVLEFGKHPSSHKFHPTEKPLSLMRYLVATYTNPGDVVLDPFCGSGTTLLAAKQEARHYIGCDSEAKYVEIARGRLASEFFLGGGGGSSPKPSTAEKEENSELGNR